MSNPKFRIWDRKNNKYINDDEASLVTLFKDGKWEPSVFTDDLPRKDDEWFVLEQYSDVYDIFGDEICEGDIIEIPDDYETHGLSAGSKYVVIFEGSGFELSPRDPKSRGRFLEDNGVFVIIGNVHEGVRKDKMKGAM